MSSLYNRLKKIAKNPVPEPKKEQLPACEIMEKRFPLRPCDIPTRAQAETMAHMCGFSLPENYRLLYLDTETTGLGGAAGTVAFLVGLGWIEGETFVCRQLFMPGYDREESLLLALSELLTPNTILVTFNGATFDVPLLAGRFVMHRMRMPQLCQVDLLFHARKIYKLRLKHVRLADMETALLGQQREDDLPGSQVPERFFRFVKVGDRSLLLPVFEHNAQDICSLAKIFCRIADAYETVDAKSDARDLYSVGRVYERRREYVLAKKYYDATYRKGYVAGAYAKGLMSKKQGLHDEAAESFLAASETSAAANVELAKYYEHKKRDYEKALAHTDRAIMLEENELLLGEHVKRRNRILRKMGGQHG